MIIPSQLSHDGNNHQTIRKIDIPIAGEAS